MGFGEPVLRATGQYKKAKGEFRKKMVRLREKTQSAEDKSCKDCFTQKEKTGNKETRTKLMIRVRLIIIIKHTYIL